MYEIPVKSIVGINNAIEGQGHIESSSSTGMKGKVTKKAVCLSNSIQHLVTGCSNIGLCYQIYHLIGFKEMLQELYSCGYIVNYDEVVKFKRCSARFLLQEKRLLSQDPPPVVNGLISAWFDNFDVVVFTPNWCRDTH